MQHSAPARNWVGDNGKIIEPLFADYFLSLHPMRCFQGRLFTVDGMVEDEAPLKKEIYEQVRYYATTSVARRIEHIMQAIKLRIRAAGDSDRPHPCPKWYIFCRRSLYP